MPASAADPGTIFTAVQDLFFQVVRARKPGIFAKHCEPIDIWNNDAVQYFSTFTEALEAFYPLTKTREKRLKPNQNLPRKRE